MGICQGKKMAKSEWANPWHVNSIQDFYFLNCPECFFKTKDDIYFQEHAVESHPLSVILFGKKGYDKLMTESDYLDMLENVKFHDSTKLLLPKKSTELSKNKLTLMTPSTIKKEFNSEEDPLLVSNLSVHEEDIPSKQDQIVHEENEAVSIN